MGGFSVQAPWSQPIVFYDDTLSLSFFGCLQYLDLHETIAPVELMRVALGHSRMIASFAIFFACFLPPPSARTFRFSQEAIAEFLAVLLPLSFSWRVFFHAFPPAFFACGT